MAKSSFYVENPATQVVADLDTLIAAAREASSDSLENRTQAAASALAALNSQNAASNSASSAATMAGEAADSAAAALASEYAADASAISAHVDKDFATNRANEAFDYKNLALSAAANAAVSAANALNSENAAGAYATAAAAYDPALFMPKAGGTFTGDVVFQGNTTTINSTNLTLVDPILTLGSTSTTVDDGKDRGIEFRYGNGTAVKTGFFGWDRSAARFIMTADATNTNEVFAGTTANLVANLVGNASTATTLQTARSISLTGDVTGSVSFNGSANVSITTTAATKASLSGATFTGNVIAPNFMATSNMVVRGGGAAAEGGHLVLGWGNNLATAINGQSNATWNIDVAGGSYNVLRFFAVDAGGTSRTPLAINGDTGVITIAASVNQTSGTFAVSANGAVAAAGTTQATATVLTTTLNVVASGTGGVVFPANLPEGTKIEVINASGTSINVYPESGSQFNGLAANVPFTLGNGAYLEFCRAASKWFSKTGVYG